MSDANQKNIRHIKQINKINHRQQNQFQVIQTHLPANE
jgi:two-component sensor histidine kinase